MRASRVVSCQLQDVTVATVGALRPENVGAAKLELVQFMMDKLEATLSSVIPAVKVLCLFLACR